MSRRIRLLLLGIVCFCVPILTRQARAQMPEPRPEAVTPASSNSSSQGAKPLTREQAEATVAGILAFAGKHNHPLNCMLEEAR